MPFVIKHDFVGPFPKGRVVTADELKQVGAEVPRLLNLGAIEQDKEAKVTEGPLPPGPHNRSGDPANAIGTGTTADTDADNDSGNDDAGNGGDNYDNMKKDELLELAATRGVPGVSNVMKKDDIIEVIRQHDATDTGAGGDGR